ncbi:MAG: stage V sporulation protein S [Atribacterales bacterium]
MTNVVNNERVQKMRVSSESQPKAVAGAIAGAIREGKDVVVSAIGAGATNQAIKSIAIANGFLAPNGIRLAVIPGFDTSEIDGKQRTLIKLDLRKL